MKALAQLLKAVQACVWALTVGATAMAQDAPAQYQPLAAASGKAHSVSVKFCLGYWGSDFACKDGVVTAVLFEPQAAWSDLVLISHGAQGVDARHYEYADALTKNGFAAVVIDHWTPRGIDITSQNYTQFTQRGGTTSSMATDAIYVAQYMRSRFPNVKRVGLIGESMGGMAVLQLSKQRMLDLFTNGSLAQPGVPFEFPIQAMVGLYAACVERVVDERFHPTPVLLISGEKDDHTLAEHCVEHQEWINTHGGSARAVVIPGVYHDFDGPRPVAFKPRAQNVSGCKNIVAGGIIRIVDSGKELPNNQAGQSQLPKECAKWGITSGYSGNRFVAVPIWMDFFKTQLR